MSKGPNKIAALAWALAPAVRESRVSVWTGFIWLLGVTATQRRFGDVAQGFGGQGGRAFIGKTRRMGPYCCRNLKNAVELAMGMGTWNVSGPVVMGSVTSVHDGIGPIIVTKWHFSKTNPKVVQEENT